MKFLLTSSGITNPSIHNALVDLLGRPIAECSALVIPTAAYYFSQGPAIAYRLISGKARGPLCELGWRSLGVLELTALPSVDRENWIPLVRDVDALPVPTSGIDDETAIKVVDGTVDVIAEGRWKLFPPTR